jgi:hypothetical protein
VRLSLLKNRKSSALMAKSSCNQRGGDRCHWLTIASVGLLLTILSPIVAIAQDASAVDDPRFTQDDNPAMRSFWSDAGAITSSQNNWFDRAEQSVMIVDPSVNQILSTKLLVQLRSMDQFLQRYGTSPYGNNPALLCAKPASPSAMRRSSLDSRQLETYCAIYQLSRDLSPLRDLMTQRASQFNLSRSGEKAALFAPIPGSQPLRPKTVEQLNIVSKPPAKPEPRQLSQLRPVGIQTLKQNVAKPRQYVSPAIAPPTEVVKLIQQGRAQLAVIQTNAPVGVSSFQVQSPQTIAIADFASKQNEADIYKDFLKQANTGLGRIYPESVLAIPDANRLEPANRPAPFALRVDANEQITIIGEALDYGFITDLGDVAIEDVSRSNLPDLFTTYQPPRDLGAIQREQRQFLAGKETEFSSEIPAMVNHTYAMRLLEYRLPDLVASGRAFHPGERGQLKSILQADGRDRIITFRPVIRNYDGSYTVLWKLLKNNPEPSVVGMERFVNLNLKTRSRN